MLSISDNLKQDVRAELEDQAVVDATIFFKPHHVIPENNRWFERLFIRGNLQRAILELDSFLAQEEYIDDFIGTEIECAVESLNDGESQINLTAMNIVARMLECITENDTLWLELCGSPIIL